MHTGPVVIADGGEVFGETASVAARVQGAAKPDTVVITAATQRLVAGLFVLDERGAQHLKGVREPVTLYRVVQPSASKGRQAGTPAPLEQEGRSPEENLNGVAQASLPAHLIPDGVVVGRGRGGHRGDAAGAG